MLSSVQLTSAETADHVAAILGAKAADVDPVRFNGEGDPFRALERTVREIREVQLNDGTDPDDVEIAIVDGHLVSLLEAVEYAASEEPDELTGEELETARALAARLGVFVT